MLNPTYTRGDAAAYAAWIARQNKHVAPLAAQFRPWEIYQLDGRDILVSVVGFESNGMTDLLQVQYVDPKYQGGLITVAAAQVTLWGLAELDPVDAEVTAA